MATSLSYLAGQTLEWVPTAAFKARYDLIGPSNSSIATLDMSNWSGKAVAHVPEGVLILQTKGMGWTQGRVEIYSVENSPRVATFQRARTGRLSMANGHQFTLVRTGWMGAKRFWKDATGTTTYIQMLPGGFSRKSQVVVLPPAAEIAELSLLLVLGLYNKIVDNRNGA
jgi:hypothetical protein